MQVNIVQRSDWKSPDDFIEKWIQALDKELDELPSHLELVIVFVEKSEIHEINAQFRKKDRPTDILSFEGEGEETLGELVLCGEIVEQQALDHAMSLREELGYLLIHGVLHLLGYDHEFEGSDAKKMFDLQDRLFDKLSGQFFEDI